MTTLHLELGKNGYDITVGGGLLCRAGEYFDLDRRVLVLTDSGVPEEYAKTVAACAKEAKIVTVPEGEGSKSLATLGWVLEEMCKLGMTRGDCVVSVGGGVVGDLGGFAAATYMRGIDFYNVPTTVLSQVDSSIGGKTAVNHAGIKNIVGAFHQPRAVLIDTDCLATLPKRQISNGLAEAVKMAMTSSAELFELIEGMSPVEILENIEAIIIESLKIKRAVVEQDEHEGGIRRILNFGHTLGHGIEAVSGKLYHGECVAIGMLPMCAPEARARLEAVLERLELPTRWDGEPEDALAPVKSDKKCVAGGVMTIYVPEIGKYEIKKMTVEEFGALARAAFR